MLNYTKEDLKKAVKDGQMSQRKASETLGIP